MKKGSMRRIISLLLATCMVLSLLPITAFAAVTDTNDWPIFTMSEYDNPETQEIVLQQMLKNNGKITAPWGTIVKEIIKQQNGEGPKLSGKTLYFQELDNDSKLIMKDSLSEAYNEAAGKLTSFINGLDTYNKGNLGSTKDFLNGKGSDISKIEAEGLAFARYQLKTLSGTAFGNEFINYSGAAGAITIQLFYDFKVEGLSDRFITPDFGIGDSLKDLKSKGIIYGLGGSSDSYTVKAENYNDFPNTVQKSYTYEKSTATSTEVSNSYTKDWSEETSVGVDIKLPFVNLVSAKVEQKVGYSYGISKTYSTSKSDSYTQSISDTIEVPLPPHTGIDIDVNIIDTTTTIPYTGAVRITYKTMVVYAACISVHEEGGGGAENANGSFSFGNETYTAIQDLDRRIVNAGIDGYDPEGLNLQLTSPGLMSNTAFKSAADKLRSGQPYSPYGGVFNYTSKGTTITPRKVIPIYPADRFVTDTEEITLYEQQSQRLDGIKLTALNEHDVPYYGFNARLDGEWTVVDEDGDENTDYAEIDTDRNGYPILKATAPTGREELYLQYKPDTSKVEVSGNYISETIELKIKPVKLSDVILEGSFPDVILDDGENSVTANDYLELMALDLDDRPFTPAPNAIVWAAEEEGRGITVTQGIYEVEFGFDSPGTYQIYAVVNEIESNRVPLTVLPARQLAEIAIQGEIPILTWDDDDRKAFKLDGINISGKDQYGDACTVKGTWALGSDGIEDEDQKIAEISGNTLTGLKAGSDMLWLRQNIGTKRNNSYVDSNPIPFTVRDASYPLLLFVLGTIPELHYNSSGNSFGLTNLEILCYDQYGEPYNLDPDKFIWELEKKDHATVKNNILTGLVVGDNQLTLSYPTKAKDDAGNSLETISSEPLDFTVKAQPYVNEFYQGDNIHLIREGEAYNLSNINLLARDQYGNPIAVPGDLSWTLAGNNQTEAVIEEGKLLVAEGQVGYASWADVILEAYSPGANQTARNVTIRVRQQPVLTKLSASVSKDFALKWQENAILNDYFKSEGFDQYGDPMTTNPVWNSSNLDAITIGNGILTFVSENGVSVITAVVGDIVSNGIKITVPGIPRVAKITVDGVPVSMPLNAQLPLSKLTAKVFDQYGQILDAKALAAYPANIRWSMEKGTTDAAIFDGIVRFGGKTGLMTLICTVVNSDTNGGLVQKRLDIKVVEKIENGGGSGGSGGSGGGGGGKSKADTNISKTPSYSANITGGVECMLPVKYDNSKGSMEVDLKDNAKNIFSAGKNTLLAMPFIPEIKSFTINLPSGSFKNSVGKTTLTLNTDIGSISIPNNMLTGLLGTTDKDLGITMAKVDKSGMPKALQQKLGDHPIIQFTLTLNGVPAVWNNPNAPVMVSMPYTPTEKELLNPDSIVIWYVDGDNNVYCIPNGIYNREIGAVTFSIDHFSQFAISYNDIRFGDVADTAWYSDAAKFLAARDITSGIAGTTFEPGSILTRGQFITMLLRAYGIKADAKAQDNFADAGNTYYTGYLAAAKRLGVSKGIGAEMFAPEQSITRQEMFTMLYKALKIFNKSPDNKGGKALTAFTDSDSIAPYAQEAMTCLVRAGIISGNNGKLEPASKVTRGEMAQVLYNLLSK